MKIKFLFEPCDLWVGAFYDRKKRFLYLLPVPCFGLVVELKKRPADHPRNVGECAAGDIVLTYREHAEVLGDPDADGWRTLRILETDQVVTCPGDYTITPIKLVKRRRFYI